MADELQWIDGGGVTSPRGFRAGAVYAGIRTYGEEPRFDVGLLVADRPCAVAGIFSSNAVVGAPIRINRPRVAIGVAKAIVANSGNANAVTGEQGDRDAERMARFIDAQDRQLPMDERLRAARVQACDGAKLPQRPWHENQSTRTCLPRTP